MMTFTYRTTLAMTGITQDFVAGVFNMDPSFGSTIQVRHVLMSPASGQTIEAMAKFQWVRTTATAGGTAVPPRKSDTGAANLPGQVTVTTLPTSVTPTTAVFFNRLDVAQYTLANTIVQRYGAARRQANMDLGSIARMTDVTVEAVMLREGEGLAGVLSLFGYDRTVNVAIMVTNLATGATYHYDAVTGYPATIGQAMVSVFNAAGSGVTLAVRAVYMPSTGTATIPQFRLARISGLLSNTATTETPIAHDPAYPASRVPWVACVKGPALAELLGRENGLPLTWESDAGAQIPVALQQRVGRFRNRVYAPWGANADSLLTPPASMASSGTLYSDGGMSNGALALGCGEGLAVLGGREGLIDDSTFQTWEVEITYTVQQKSRTPLPGAVYVS